MLRVLESPGRSFFAWTLLGRSGETHDLHTLLHPRSILNPRLISSFKNPLSLLINHQEIPMNMRFIELYPLVI